MIGWLGAPAVAVVVAVAAIAGCGSDGPNPPAGASPPVGSAGLGSDGAHFTKIADFGEIVTSMTPLPDESGFLVSTRTGLVYKIDNTDVDGYVVPVVDPSPVLDLSDRTATAVEQGLLGLAMNEDGTVLFTYYTALDASLTVEAFPYAAGRQIDASSGHIVLSLAHPHWGHNGGAIVRTPSGDLLVTGNGLDDWPRAGSSEVVDTRRGGEDDVTELGILRIPKSSLALDAARFTPSRTDFVARGLRNPWAVSLDPATGDLWIADVGEMSREEIDRVPDALAADSPLDFGWPFFEGTSGFRASGQSSADFTMPVLERAHDDAVCAVAGAFVYRGDAIPSLVGQYLFGDMCSLEIRGFDSATSPPEDHLVATTPERPTSFGQDPAGEVYLLGDAGGVYRLDPAEWQPDDLAQRVEPRVTSTTTLPYPEEACGMSAALIAVHDLGAAPPDTLRAAYLNTREEYGPVMEQLGSDGTLLLRSIDRFIEVGEAAGWNVDDPAFREVQDATREGVGEFEGLPEAISRIFESETASCP